MKRSIRHAHDQIADQEDTWDRSLTLDNNQDRMMDMGLGVVHLSKNRSLIVCELRVTILTEKQV